MPVIAGEVVAEEVSILLGGLQTAVTEAATEGATNFGESWSREHQLLYSKLDSAIAASKQRIDALLNPT